MAKTKYYVVWEGRKPGVYSTWDECKKQTDGIAGAKYKSFESKDLAESAFKGNYWQFVSGSPATASTKSGKQPRSAIVKDSISVDAACSGNPGDMEYRGVVTSSGKEIFRVGPLPDGTNNIGEYLALVHGLALLKKEGMPQMPIYSDSLTGRAWVKKGKANTTLERTARNGEIFLLLERAEKWLALNAVTNPILIWETKDWGEIPADFGRK
jgi:ribonuclease HI